MPAPSLHYQVTEAHNHLALIPSPTQANPNPKPILIWEQKPDPFSFSGEIAQGEALNDFLDMAWELNHPQEEN